MKLIRKHTDWTRRYHLEVDQDRPVNCFIVELPPYLISPSGIGLPVLPRPGKTLVDDLWQEALATLEFLRAQIHEPLYPPEAFQPWGIIQARNLDDVRREFEIWRDMWLGGCFDSDEEWRRKRERNAEHDDHDSRVQSLIRALDLLNGAPLPQAIPLSRLPWARLQ